MEDQEQDENDEIDLESDVKE